MFFEKAKLLNCNNWKTFPEFVKQNEIFCGLHLLYITCLGSGEMKSQLQSPAYFHRFSKKFHGFFLHKNVIFLFHTEMAGHYRIQLPETNCRYISLSTGTKMNHKPIENEMDSIRRSLYFFKVNTFSLVSHHEVSVLYWYPSSYHHSFWSQTFWWERVFHPKAKASLFPRGIHYLRDEAVQFFHNKTFPSKCQCNYTKTNIFYKHKTCVLSPWILSKQKLSTKIPSQSQAFP